MAGCATREHGTRDGDDRLEDSLPAAERAAWRRADDPCDELSGALATG